MKKGDVLLAVIAVVFLFLWMIPRGSGTLAVICVDGEVYKRVPLDVNTRIDVKSRYGENTVVIENGCIYIEDADCPDKICEREKISNTGRSIVCLPNRLSVQIESKNQKEEIDVTV